MKKKTNKPEMVTNYGISSGCDNRQQLKMTTTGLRYNMETELRENTPGI